MTDVTPVPSAPTIVLDNLDLGYGQLPVVRSVTANIALGSVTGIIGPNGAGKSTLLRGIAGELRPLRGRITIENRQSSSVAYLPQNVELDPHFPLRMFDAVAMGLWHEVGAFAGLSANHVQRVHAAIAQVGLMGLEQHPIGSLSAGQIQRALFARMLLQGADVLLLDEPFAAIDAATETDLWQVIQELRREGRTIVIVLHNVETVRQACSDVMLLANELIAQGPPAEVLVPHVLQNVWYHRHPRQALPKSAGDDIAPESRAKAA